MLINKNNEKNYLQGKMEAKRKFFEDKSYLILFLRQSLRGSREV